MAIDVLVKPLLSLPLFAGLERHQLEDIARTAERTTYPRGTAMAVENATSDASIIIISGTCVRVGDEGGSLQGEALAPGSMIAELAMLVDVVHPSTIMARDNVRALRLTRKHMLAMMEKDPALAQHFCDRLTQRLKAMGDVLKRVQHDLDAAVPPVVESPAPVPMLTRKAV